VRLSTAAGAPLAARPAFCEDLHMTRTAAPPHRAIPRGPVRRTRRRWRRAGGATLTGLVVVALAGVGIAVTVHVAHGPADAQCTVTGSGLTYDLTPEQAGNAAIISAVALREALPHHAVTIALATALQESKLRNLDYGDRDSLGLFQQRPSEGWGTAAEVSDPNYASAAFYRALVKLPHWQSDDVATAAQDVQRSADGAAYESWEGEARALAIALTGEQPAALACSGGTLSTAHATTSSSAAAVSSALTAALGPDALSPGTNTGLGQAASAWLVAASQADGIVAVAYDGHQWSAARGSWVADPAAGGTVTFRLARPTAA
jgi:hypothetical protein